MLKLFIINITLKIMIDGNRCFKLCLVNLMLKFVLNIVYMISI
jgi:hypothetical protein